MFVDYEAANHILFISKHLNSLQISRFLFFRGETLLVIRKISSMDRFEQIEHIVEDFAENIANDW